MSGADVFANAKTKAKKLREGPAGRKVTGVTKENYPALAKAFMEERGNQGFVIVERGNKTKGWTATHDEWAAWIAYFFKLGKPIKPYEDRGYATVPCQWPYDFDENSEVGASLEAAKYHRENMRRRIAAEKVEVDMAEVAPRIQSMWKATQEKRPLNDPMPIKTIVKEPEYKKATPEDMAASLARCLKHNAREYQP